MMAARISWIAAASQVPMNVLGRTDESSVDDVSHRVRLDHQPEGCTMRKLIVAIIMSLDGYFEGPGGNVMALPMDGFFDEHNLERLRAADTLLLGATTYMGLKGYWPVVAANPGVSPAVAANPDLAGLHRETGQRNNEIQKVVVSDSLTADDTAPWSETTSIVGRADAHQAVVALKDRPGKEILMFGSRTLWTDLLVAGLVDELHLMVGPAVLGGGTPAFGTGPVPPLRLVTARRRDGSDNLLLRYEVIGRDA
jgi:dihydrofolate reductase